MSGPGPDRPSVRGPQRAVIVGAGPAGLTAAHELLTRTGIRPLVLEAGDGVGGISRTFVHHGNRIDLGGHRFFSKSRRVMKWWQDRMPVRDPAAGPIRIRYQNRAADVMPAGATGDGGMGDDGAGDDGRPGLMVRDRVSRILFRGRFFDYPLALSFSTLGNLGLATTVRAGASYLGAKVAPRRPERTLEDFLINRFGRHLYGTFFRDYTRKVWGVPCHEIPADWGAQRIKGLSVAKLLRHALRALVGAVDRSPAQSGTETSLIERFLYPPLGPGQMWDRVADEVRELGGDIRLNHQVVRLHATESRVWRVEVAAGPDGRVEGFEADWVFSTMPIRDLIAGLQPAPPGPVREVAAGLVYRDFMTVGLLLRRLAVHGGVAPGDLAAKLADNWIYVQEPGVSVGRIQIFNNWSPALVADPDTIWIGLEYFLNESDRLWSLADDRVVEFAVTEMAKIGFLAAADVIDATVIRQPKAYPAYFGSYHRLPEVVAYLDRFENLFAIGRNGQHRYNNQDHSMLAAMVAVDLIVAGRADKSDVWRVNTETDYLEQD